MGSPEAQSRFTGGHAGLRAESPASALLRSGRPGEPPEDSARRPLVCPSYTWLWGQHEGAHGTVLGKLMAGNLGRSSLTSAVSQTAKMFLSVSAKSPFV